MKAPRKVAKVVLSPKLGQELKDKRKNELKMGRVSDDQVWRHDNGTEYTTILITNLAATKDGYPVTVCYYGPDGVYWSQPLERFVLDKTYLRQYVSKPTPAEEALGSWMSAGLEDPDACIEFKRDALNWLNEVPFPKG